ncbi:19978_t:CDS:2, partial [Gigaspora rosea]
VKVSSDEPAKTPPKLVNIVQGKGLPLGQIPSVDRAIDKHKP